MMRSSDIFVKVQNCFQHFLNERARREWFARLRAILMRGNKSIDAQRGELLKLTGAKETCLHVARASVRRRRSQKIDTDSPLDAHRLRINQIARQRGYYRWERRVLEYLSICIFIRGWLTFVVSRDVRVPRCRPEVLHPIISHISGLFCHYWIAAFCECINNLGA